MGRHDLTPRETTPQTLRRIIRTCDQLLDMAEGLSELYPEARDAGAWPGRSGGEGNSRGRGFDDLRPTETAALFSGNMGAIRSATRRAAGKVDRASDLLGEALDILKDGFLMMDPEWRAFVMDKRAAAEA